MLRLFQPRRPAADNDTASAPADKPRHRRTASDGTHETDTEELSTLSATSSGVGRPAADPHSPENRGTIVPGAPRVELLDMPGPSANSASTPVASGRKGKAGEGAGEEDTPVVDLLGLRPYDHRSSPASVPDEDGSDSSSSCSEGGTADAHIYAADRLASLMSPPSSAPGAAGNAENNSTPAPSTPAADDALDDSLRRSTETNALDSICTGDHVSAMLREYQGGGGSRWDRSGGADGIGPSYTAEMQANIFKANIKAHKSLLGQIAEPDEVLTDTSDRPIRSRIQKKRRGKEKKGNKQAHVPGRPQTPTTPADDNSSRRSSARSVDSSSLKTCDIPVDQEMIGDRTGWDEEMAAEAEAAASAAPARFAEVNASAALTAARDREARKEARREGRRSSRASLGDEVDDPHGLNEARLRSRLECGTGDGMDGSRGGGDPASGGSPGRMGASVHSASTAPVVNTSDGGGDGRGGRNGDASPDRAAAPASLDHRSLEKLLWDNNSQDGAYSLNLGNETEKRGPMRNLARTLGRIGRRASDAMAPAIVVEREDVYEPTSGRLVRAGTGGTKARGEGPRMVPPLDSPAMSDAGDAVDDSYDLTSAGRLSALGGLPGFKRRGSADSMWSAFGRRGSGEGRRGSEESGMETGEGSSESGGALSRKASGGSAGSDEARLGRVREGHGGFPGWSPRRRSGRASTAAASSRGPSAGADSDEENQNGHDDFDDIDGALNGNGDTYQPTRSLLGNIRGASFQRGTGRRTSRRNSDTPYVDDEGTTFDEYGDLSSLTAGDGRTVYRPGLQTIGRCCAVLLVIAVVAIGSTLVGVLVPRGEGRDEGVAYIPVPPGVDSLDSEITDLSMATPYTTSELKNMVVSVESHCTPTKLSSTTGSWECEQICHSHLCCFDPKGHGWCGGDANKLCPVFVGCKVLAAPELALTKEDEEIEAKAQGKVEVVDLPYEEGDHKGDGYISNALPEEKDMGWLDIRRKRTSVYCSPTNLETTNGRAQCHEVCSQHFCCVEPDPTSLESCARDPSKTCDVYESCRNYVLLEDRESILDGAFDGHTLINIDGSEMDVDEWIEMNEDLPLPPGAPRPEGEDMVSEKHLGYDMPDFDEDVVDEFGPPPGDDVMSDAIVPIGMNVDPDNIGSDHQNMDIVYIPGAKPHENAQGKGTSGYTPGGYTADPMESVASYDHIGMVPADLPEYLTPVGFDETSVQELEEVAKRSDYDWDEIHEMKADVKERCSNAVNDSASRLSCEQVCRFHFCCFHSGNLGCATNPDKVCYVYQDCKKLLGTDGTQLDMYIDRYRDEAPGASGAGRLPTFADGGATGDFSVPADDEEPEFEPDYVPEPDEAVEDAPASDEVVPFDEAADGGAGTGPAEEEDVGALSSYAAAALFDEGGCIDDPRFSFDNGSEGTKTCETYVSDVGRPAVLRNRCDQEQDDGKLLSDHCRKSCGNCPEAEETAVAETEFDAAAAALFDKGGCVDDPRFSFDNGSEGTKTCETYVSDVGRPAVLQNRCDQEQDDGKLLSDYCRKSCGNCDETGFDAAAAALFDEGGCVDDPRFSFDNVDSGSDSEGNTCKTFVAEVGRPAVLQNRCDREQDDGKLLRDYCRKSCGNCSGGEGTVAAEEAVDLEEAVQKIPPPPVRCIPEGDDEVFAEVYQDDMTDDRYDRCKRWEKKHGMTVAAYWDGHGIDSELELNVMETMVTMDKREDELEASPAAEEAAPDAAPASPEPAASEPEPAPLPEPNTAGCVDDPSFSFLDGDKGDKTCDTYVAGVGRPAVLQNRCDHDLGSGKSLKDYCPKSCGVCEAGEGTRATLALDGGIKGDGTIIPPSWQGELDEIDDTVFDEDGNFEES